MEKIEKRLAELYKGRNTTEERLLHRLRYNGTETQIKECVDSLLDYRGRIQEIEMLLSSPIVDRIKKECEIKN